MPRFINTAENQHECIQFFPPGALESLWASNGVNVCVGGRPDAYTSYVLQLLMPHDLEHRRPPARSFSPPGSSVSESIGGIMEGGKD